MGWFAVLSVYQFGRKTDGTNIFEERVVGFCAESFDEAISKGEEESAKYAADHNMDPLTTNQIKAHDLRHVYAQDGEALIDGYELWSILLESNESLDEFYASRYTRYQYHPD